jgi:CDP-glucose 4,6-dehydratase
MPNGKFGNMELGLSSYKGKKVFVTGHTGFKGSWLLAMLHHLGAIVKGYSLEPEHSKELFESIHGSQICEHVIGNITNQEKLSHEIEAFQPDFIFHLAAQPLVRESYAIPSETFLVNVIGTSYVLEAALKLSNPCAVIVITTDKVYENKETGIQYSEEDVLGGHDPYSTSKACAELVTRSFIRSFLTEKSVCSFTTVRAGNVIGGGDYSVNRIVPDFVRSIQQKTTLELRYPHAVRPWQHVLEPLVGYLKLGLLKANNILDLKDAYNFGPEEKDQIEVVELIQKAIAYLSKGSFSFLEGETLHEAGQLRLNIDSAWKDLAWKPIYDAEKAIHLSMDWYFSQDKERTTYDQIKNYLDAVERN